MARASENSAEFFAAYGAAIAQTYERGRAGALKLPAAELAEALRRGVQSLEDQTAGAIDRYLTSVHAEDLALACACRLGLDAAWERFIARYRPVLYDAARAILRDDVRGRELADSLWADLYGLKAADGERRSLLDYFHGRSSLATWLRAVVARRHIDILRAQQPEAPLDSVEPERIAMAADPPDPDRIRYMKMLGDVLAAALATLKPRDLMRLRYYYADGLTLGEIGRLMGEREWTVSRALKRTRGSIRARVEHALGSHNGLSPEQIRQCYDYAVEEWPFELAGISVPIGGDAPVQQKPGRSFQE